MPNIEIGRSTYRRAVAKESSVVLKNRYFETNPVLNSAQDPMALISRPRLKKAIDVGTGRGRKVYSEPGAFGDDLFVVNGLSLYRVDRISLAVDNLGVISTDDLASVTMCATGNIGVTPGYLFIAEGGILWVYCEDGSAQGHLSASGAIANNDVVRIGAVYYQFTNASVDAGTPAGTAGFPWLVKLGASNGESLGYLYSAINASGTPGTDYSTVLVAHPLVVASGSTSTDLFVQAIEAGSGGNSIVTTETGANISWASGTLTGGGTEQLRQVPVPDDVGAIAVAHFNSYVIVIPVQGQGVNGQFYWIEPGETTIDPLNFATAERSPDPINQVLALSDRFFLFGDTTTEAWITTGSLEAPMQRFQGVLYDRGSWPGTAVRINDMIIIMDPNGGVFQVSGGVREISRQDIAERNRRAIQHQGFFSP